MMILFGCKSVGKEKNDLLENSERIKIWQEYIIGKRKYVSEYEGVVVCSDDKWIYLLRKGENQNIISHMLLQKRFVTKWKSLSVKDNITTDVSTIDEVIKKVIKEQKLVSIYWKDNIYFIGEIKKMRNWCYFNQVTEEGRNNGILMRDLKYIRAIEWGGKLELTIEKWRKGG